MKQIEHFKRKTYLCLSVCLSVCLSLSISLSLYLSISLSFLCEKGVIFLTSRKYVHCKMKVILKILPLERTMGGPFNFSGCNKLEKNSFNNILAMSVSFVIEFNSTNSSSADTNLDTFRFYQQIVATWQFKEGLKEAEKENIWIAVEKMRKRKRKFERKKTRYKLCREEMDATEELKIVVLLL